MPKYKLRKPAFVSTLGCAIPQHFKAGSIVEVADDVKPSMNWEPLDKSAQCACEAAQRDFVVAKNGVQVIDRATGRVRVTRHGEQVPRAAPLKPSKSADAPRESVPEKAADRRDSNHAEMQLALADTADPATDALGGRPKR